MLNVGCTPQEVIETILHALVYAGFSTAQEGIAIAREVFKERKLNYKPVSARPEDARDRLGIQNLQQTEALNQISKSSGESVMMVNCQHPV